MECTITYKPNTPHEDGTGQASPLVQKKSATSRRAASPQRGKSLYMTPKGGRGRSFRELLMADTDSLIAPRHRGISMGDDDERRAEINLPDINQSAFMTGDIKYSERRNSATSRPSSSTPRHSQHECPIQGGVGPPQISLRSQSASHISRPSFTERRASCAIPELPEDLLHRDCDHPHGSVDPDVSLITSVNGGYDGGDISRPENKNNGKRHLTMANRLKRKGYWNTGGGWIPPEKEDLLQILEEERQFLQIRIEQFLKANNPK